MIYFLQRANGDIKIGVTKRYTDRARQLSKEHGELKLLALVEGSFETEKELHREFRNFWTGDSEWFQDAPAIHEFIASHDCLPLPARKAETRQPYSLTARIGESQTTMRNAIIAALVQGGTISKAAKILGIHHSTLLYQMSQHNMTLDYYVVLKIDNEEVTRFKAESR